MPQAPNNLREFESLVEIVKTLRGPQGCPWDKKQTHKSLTRFAIEEAFELAEAIDREATQEIKEELGDLLLQVVLHSEIARQKGTFEIADVVETLSEKMIRRHPHVFGDGEVQNSQEVEHNWAEIKAQEKPDKSPHSFALPADLPALLTSFKIGEKTTKKGFDWARPEEVMQKVEEELSEFKETLSGAEKSRQSHELGDLLFSLAQLARHLDIDPEQALRQTNLRFERRYKKMRELADAEKQNWDQLTPNEKEAYWAQSKKSEG